MSQRAGSMHFGSSDCRRGIQLQARCSSPKQAVSIGTITGDEYNQRGHIVAGTPKVYPALLEVLAPFVPPELRPLRGEN